MPAFSVPDAAGSYELDDDPARIDPAAAAADHGNLAGEVEQVHELLHRQRQASPQSRSP